MLDSVAVAGISETEKHRVDSKTAEDYYSLGEYYVQAARLTLDSAGIEKSEIEGFGIVNSEVDTPYIYPTMPSQTLGFSDLKWVVSADSGGSSPLSLLLQGALVIKTGIVDTFLCLGADVPAIPHEGRESRTSRGYDKNYLELFGTQGPNERIAQVQTAHMDEHDTTAEQLGEIPVTQREHAVRNEKAYFNEEIELGEYLDAPPIADPIRLLDCVIPVNGGFGVLLTSAERAEDLDVPPVSIDGFGECHNHDIHGTPDMTRTGIEVAGPAACEMAGIDPADADFVQLYDDYPIIVAIQLEDLGFCEKGGGGSFVAETDIAYDGELPVNTSGGQISAGQVGLAGGFLQLVEGVRQLRGEGGDRQVPGAQQGIVTGVGGVEYGNSLRSTNAVVLSGGDQ